MWIQELERTATSALEHALRLEGELASRGQQLEEARRLAEERLRALEERDAEVARLIERQQAPLATDSVGEVAELKRQLEAAQAV